MDVSQINRFKAYLNMPRLRPKELRESPKIFFQVPIKPDYYQWISSLFLNDKNELMVEIIMDPDIYFHRRLRDIPQHLINKIENEILNKALYGNN